ncbi:hypothetical protein SAMN02745134_00782 [Clostridium acidisoli DSM 12555]|uniref:Uncharacterized protein n=2 Tax=Clostridium TaxID=1485 RepID=A0A1W1X5N4_9CLOT|nr:hypothetical protein SAMN02745134_00782 [Clostridium acidisoli DSM 12555]
MIYCCIVTLIMSLNFMTSCGEKYSQQIHASKTSATQVISNSKIKSIKNSGTISLVDDSPASLYWVPKNQRTTLYEVTSWLQQAKLYEGEIPKSQSIGIFNGNINPSILYIKTSNEHEITIQPAFYFVLNNGKSFEVRYVHDVLQLNNDKQKIYIQSSKLFKWLRNDKWKTEFER